MLASGGAQGFFVSAQVRCCRRQPDEADGGEPEPGGVHPWVVGRDEADEANERGRFGEGDTQEEPSSLAAGQTTGVAAFKQPFEPRGEDQREGTDDEDNDRGVQYLNGVAGEGRSGRDDDHDHAD
jgi:hypothetical protein